ncbi:ImmA/IrrE family metallo-endopeptidase [Bradyrhizobium sp.]|uniref:ImmA/IrrE family metallo-endopeptidase n=1 Tax=Bradyrhizobium sp. TaxID=376 RepID=UPI0035A0B9A3
MSADSLKFLLTWAPPGGEDARLTTVGLAVRIGERTIWPIDGADEVILEVQADDLLSYLTEFWKPLILRQTYPVAIQPERPSLLRAEAEKRWGSAPEETIEREDGLVTAFEEAHDLSRSFAGMFDLPPFWLVRQGDRMLVETRAGLRSVTFENARSALGAAGDDIALHLEATKDDRWSDLLTAWRRRDRGDPATLLAWATSLDRGIAASFVKEGLLAAPDNVAEAANDNDELRIAARMASALPQEQIRQIIALVGSFEKCEAESLYDLGKDVRAYITKSFGDRRPFEQGEAAANFVRSRLNLSREDKVDVFGTVERLGASLQPKSVEPATLFALAVWGPRHGPAVLLNELAMNWPRDIAFRDNWLARVTLAHELCHLLVDQEHTLTAIEVLHSRMPLDIERRAKAFAGELLLPGIVAAELWEKAKSPRSLVELDKFISELCRDFGVTKSVAAWKLEHGLHKKDIDLRVLLDAVAPNR